LEQHDFFLWFFSWQIFRVLRWQQKGLGVQKIFIFKKPELISEHQANNRLMKDIFYLYSIQINVYFFYFTFTPGYEVSLVQPLKSDIHCINHYFYAVHKRF